MRVTPPKRRRRHTEVAATLAILLLLATNGVPQEVEGEFFEQVAVDIVNVEVFVTDKQGNPVTDLARDDFEIFEDQRPVELLNFYRVAGGVPNSRVASVPEVVDAPQPPTPAADFVPDNQRLHVIVYVDNFHIDPLNRNRAFRRLREFLRQTLKPGDEVLLATYDRSLHIRQPFTGNVEAVIRAITEVEKITGFAASRERERSEALKKIYEVETLQQALWEAKRFSDQAEFSLRESLNGLNEMLDSLAGLPGRKMLVHLSDGMPMVPGQDLYQAIQSRFSDLSALGEAFSRDASRNYMRMISDANSGRISIYTIDTGGLRTKSGMGAENPAIATPIAVSSAVDSVKTSNLQDTLVMVAARTGGRSIINTNDIRGGLAGFTSDLENYYSLGYRAPLRERGRYHKIEVRLKNKPKGWRIRHREGYRDKSVEVQMGDAAYAFLIHGYQSNPLGVQIDLGNQREDDKGNIDVAINVSVPLAEVAFLPRPGFHEARLKLYFAAIDEKGRKAPLEELPFELRIPDEAIERARRDSLLRTINAKMRPGPHKIVVGVRDEIGAERSIVGRYVTIESPG